MQTKSVKVKKKPISYQNKRKINGIIFMLPWILGFILFFIIPLINTVRYSFSTVSVAESGGMSLKFVGFQNYVELFSTEISKTGQQFLRVFIDENSAILVNTPVIVIFSLFCALLVNAKYKGRGIARVIFFLPLVLGLDVVVNLLTVSSIGDVVDEVVTQNTNNEFIMQFLLNYTFLPEGVTQFIYGLTNNVFELISQTGVQTLIFLAGLQSINGALYEVARIEGASQYEVFWKITLPMLSNISIFALVYTFVDRFLRSSITQEIYFFAFNKSKIGTGSALSMVYLVNVIVDMLIMLLIVSRVVKSKNVSKSK